MSQGGVISIPSNVAESFVANIGSAAPSGGILNIVGGPGITTSASGNTLTITNTQTSTLTFQTAGGNAVSSAGAITFTGAGGLAFSGAGSTVTGTLSAIPNASLANSAVTINVSNGLTGGGSVSLGGSVNIVGSGTPAPTSGNLVLIQSQTASSSSTLTFSTGLIYNEYVLRFSNVNSSVNNTALVAVLSTNGGSSYLNSGYISNVANIRVDNGGLGVAAQTTANWYLSQEMNTSGFTLSGQYYISNMLVGTPTIVGQISLFTDTFNFSSTTFGTQTTGNINAIQIAPASGNIATGTFKLYGVVP